MTVAGRWFRASGDKQDEQNQIRGVDGHIAAQGYTPGKTYTAHALERVEAGTPPVAA